MGRKGCKCGGEPKNPGNIEGVSIPLGDITGSIFEKARQQFGSSSLPFNNGIAGGSAGSVFVQPIDDFCSKNPEDWYGEYGSQSWADDVAQQAFQQKVNELWNEHCKCKQNCPGEGNCCTQYTSKTRLFYSEIATGKTFTIEGDLNFTGPIRGDLFIDGNGDVFLPCSQQNPTTKECIPYNELAYGFGKPRNYKYEKTLIYDIKRLDNQPDDCTPAPEKPKPPPPPPPIFPILIFPPPPPEPEPEPEKKTSYPGFPVPEDDDMACCDELKAEIAKLSMKIDASERRIKDHITFATLGVRPALAALAGINIADLVAGRFEKIVTAAQIGAQILESLARLAEAFPQLDPGDEPGEDEGEGEGEEEEGLVTVQVPVVSCVQGQPKEEQLSIQIRKDMAESIRYLFREIASVRAYNCVLEGYSKRNYEILGGDSWYTSKDGKSKAQSGIEVYLESFINRYKVASSRNPANGELNEAESTYKNLPQFLAAISGVLYQRLGLSNYPLELPKTLLTYTDDDPPIHQQSLTAYLNWIVEQMDGLIGQFPIEIEIEDADPLQEGKQPKRIELPNISEALSELFSLTVSGATNSDLAINFLMRVAVEVIAAKNAALVAQDYSRANADFLGYKGNVVGRKIKYAFNPAELDNFSKFLTESEGEIQGWQEEDKESVVAFLQKIVFSSGIIKAAFFRNPKQMKILKKEFEGLLKESGKTSDQKWQQFLQMINQADSQFNVGLNAPIPDLDNKPVPKQNPDPPAKK